MATEVTPYSHPMIAMTTYVGNTGKTAVKTIPKPRVPLPPQPPWEELIKQQLEIGNNQKKKFQQLAKLANANALRMLPAQSNRNMAAYLLCLTSGGGVPLFTRKKGDLKALPFPVIGSLNGVHLFAKTKDVSLFSTHTKDTKVVWKVFHDSITLIIVCNDDGASDSHLQCLLQAVFNAMILLIGLDDLIRIKNVERLKRDLRCSYQLIDAILEQTDAEYCLFGTITQMVDCLFTTDNQVLQNFLEAFVENVGSTYGCLIVHGRVAVATEKWWNLTGTEASLLSLFLHLCPKTTTLDIPVFLPVGSPTVPHRLLAFTLIAGVEVCVLCGPTPTLAHLDKEIVHYWRNAFENLKNASNLYPRCFPAHITVDKNVLGFIIINQETHQSLCSVHVNTDCNSNSETTKLPSVKWRQEILKRFYFTITSSCFLSPETSDSTEYGQKVFHTRLKHQANESYILSDHHKCYALQSGPYQLFILFTIHIPTFAMRSVCHQMLNTFVKDKYIHL